MTGTIGSTAVISNFSLALLRDSGLVKFPEVFIIICIIIQYFSQRVVPW